MTKFERLADRMTRNWKGKFEYKMELKVGKIPCYAEVLLFNSPTGKQGMIEFATRPMALRRYVIITPQFFSLLVQTYDSTAGERLEELFANFANELTYQLRLWQHCDIHPNDLEARSRGRLSGAVKAYLDKFNKLDQEGTPHKEGQILLTEAVRYYNAKRKAQAKQQELSC